MYFDELPRSALLNFAIKNITIYFAAHKRTKPIFRIQQRLVLLGRKAVTFEFPDEQGAAEDDNT